MTLPPAGVRHPDSTAKLMHQIAAVSMVDLTYQAGGRSETISAPREGCSVTQSFWRSYGCYLGCGACCPAFTLDYLRDDYSEFERAYPEHKGDGAERRVSVNGAELGIVSIMQERRQERHGRAWCQYLDLETGGCTVHLANPLSCRIELIKFRIVKERGMIFKGPFGRAWNLTRVDGVKGQPLCDFGPWSQEQFESNDLPILRRMLRWAEAFDIPTYLPKIIADVQRDAARGKYMVRNYGKTVAL